MHQSPDQLDFFSRVSFWPAAITAWCYPMTAFFIFWQGYPTCASIYWLPWLLLTVDRTIRGQNPMSPIALALVTGLGRAGFGSNQALASRYTTMSAPLWVAIFRISRGGMPASARRASSW